MNANTSTIDAPMPTGTTGTGLDRFATIITHDPGLLRKVSPSDIAAGAEAADAMNHLLVEAIRATGAANNGEIGVADLRNINAYLRDNHLAEWTALHGDDETGEETGFHLVQADGAITDLFGFNAVNRVADSIYHLGFVVSNGRLVNEDGNLNAPLSAVSYWLNQLLATDLAGDALDNPEVSVDPVGGTGTGLDQLVAIIADDAVLGQRQSASEIYQGAMAADGMNHLIVEAIQATGAADEGVIEVSEVREMNVYLREHHLDQWTLLHGDDEKEEETGFHLVQADGAITELFGLNAVNRVADGLYHLGFEINRAGRFLNEDGNPNAHVTKVAEWLNLLLADDLADGSLLVLPVGVPSATEALFV